MNWADKMDAVVKDILGTEYTCVVESDKSFGIFKNDEKIAKRTSIHYLESHWRHEISETLKVIFNDKVRDSLLKN